MSKLHKDDEISLIVQEDPTPGRQLLTKRERKKNISFLTISTFLASSANSIHFAFYSLYFTKLCENIGIENSERIIGITTTVAAFVAIIGIILADYLNLLVGYKRVFIIAQALIALAFSFFLFDEFNRLGLVIAAAMILSLGFSLNESPYAIILTETAGEDKKGTISALTSFFGRFGEVIILVIVFIVTYVLGITYTNNERSYYYLFAAIAVALIAIGIVFFVTDPSRKYKEIALKEQEIEQSQEQLNEDEEEVEEPIEMQEKKTGFIRGFIDTFKDKWVLRIAFTFFMDALLWGIALGVHWPGLQSDDLFIQDLALKDNETSLLLLATSLTVLALMYFGKFVDKFGAKLFLFISEICGLLWIILSVVYTYLVFYLQEQFLWIMIIARISLGASIALWIPSTTALFTNVVPERKSKVYNSIAIFRSIGWLPGGFIAGFLFDSIPQPYGFLTPMFILIGGMFFLIPLFYTIPNRPSDMKNNKNKPKKSKTS
ncbi:MAG: MFS transporter [Asgard group archaeon]|nr:MFS transporter [Asgard group archaeon]